LGCDKVIFKPRCKSNGTVVSPHNNHPPSSGFLAILADFGNDNKQYFDGVSILRLVELIEPL
jgi:hypothetical protein